MFWYFLVIRTPFNSTTSSYVFFGDGNYAEPGLEFVNSCLMKYNAIMYLPLIGNKNLDAAKALKILAKKSNNLLKVNSSI